MAALDTVAVSPDEETPLVTDQQRTNGQYDTIPQNQNNNQTDQTEDSNARTIGRWLFRVFSGLTCQYIPPVKHGKCCSYGIIIYAIFCTTIFGILINIYPTGIFLADWIKCPIRYYNICYSLEFHSKDPNSPLIPNIVLKDIDKNGTNNPIYGQSDLLTNSDTRSKLEAFVDFGKITLLFSSTSSSLSYLIFVYALWKLYIKQHCKEIKCIVRLLSGLSSCLYFIVHCEKREEEEEDIEPLHPFDDDLPKYPNEVHSNNNICQGNSDDCPAVCKLTINQDNDTTTRLDKKELKFFILYVVVNIGLFVAMAIVFLVGQYRYKPMIIDDDTNQRRTEFYANFEKSAVSAYLYSHLCSLSSCYIFSKIMYGIQKKCSNLNKYLDHVNKFGIDQNKNAFKIYLKNTWQNKNEERLQILERLSQKDNMLYYLKQRDKHFILVAAKTLKIFQFWFFVHWIFYIISSFLSISLVLEATLLTIKGRQSHIKSGVNFQALEMVFLTLFAASNSFLFLFPCLRAASITTSRKKLISTITSQDYPNIDDRVKSDFVNYLETQKFCFRLNILCAKIPFSVNIAYISICVGLLTTVVSVVASISL